LCVKVTSCQVQQSFFLNVESNEIFKFVEKKIKSNLSIGVQSDVYDFVEGLHLHRTSVSTPVVDPQAQPLLRPNCSYEELLTCKELQEAFTVYGFHPFPDIATVGAANAKKHVDKRVTDSLDLLKLNASWKEEMEQFLSYYGNKVFQMQGREKELQEVQGIDSFPTGNQDIDVINCLPQVTPSKSGSRNVDDVPLRQQKKPDSMGHGTNVIVATLATPSLVTSKRRTPKTNKKRITSGNVIVASLATPSLVTSKRRTPKTNKKRRTSGLGFEKLISKKQRTKSRPGTNEHVTTSTEPSLQSVLPSKGTTQVVSTTTTTTTTTSTAINDDSHRTIATPPYVSVKRENVHVDSQRRTPHRRKKKKKKSGSGF